MEAQEYEKLVKALTCGNDGKLPCHNIECPYWVDKWHGIGLCNVIKKDADAAAAIEELRFELDCVNDSIKQLALPVDGEWVRVEDGDSWHYECSRCRERPLYSLYGDIVLSGTCPTCGAKMEGCE